MKHHIILGGVVEYFIPGVAKGTEWDEMHVQNVALDQHADRDDLTHVLVVTVPRARVQEAREAIESALTSIS